MHWVAAALPTSVALAHWVPEDEHKDASVGVKLAARRGLGSGQWISRRNVIALDDEPRTRKRAIHVFAFAVDCRIDLVRQAIIPLVPLEPDIVCRRHAPQRSPADLVRRFPNTQVIP